MRVGVFFKTTPCSSWNDVLSFLKVSSKQETIEAYFERYRNGLATIAGHAKAPKEVRERAEGLLSTTSVELFRQKHAVWQVEMKKDEAKQSLAEGYASLAKGAGSMLKDDGGTSSQVVNRASSVSSSSLSSLSFKKRKRSITNINSTSMKTITAMTSAKPDLSSRKARFAAMDRSQFWKLRSGRAVEEVLYHASMKQEANFKMRSYTIDFGCERTRVLFTVDEWEEMKKVGDFQLPRLSETIERYLYDVRLALLRGEHVASTAYVNRVSYGFRTQLYVTKPCPFDNKDLSESFWTREAWPIMKGLLSDVDGVTMIDGEKAGLESGKRKNMGRKVDMETSPPRKQSGRKLDLVARDTTNKRDWFVVESHKEWDEVSTKFLHELDVTLFKDLHLISSHRFQEQPSSHFRSQARFFAIYSGGRGFKTMEMRASPFSAYIMLVHLYSSYQLPPTATVWKLQSQGLAHLLQVRSCVKRTVEMYETEESEKGDDEWLYSSLEKHIYDETLGSSPTDPTSSDIYSS
ncbi:hypothetical protein BCR41DRAFT_392126 [Lobosporangium transversale]|uniref:Uncharacterized protein n=1 Tax=Lobosporangium transversale TaxID=64571 RepID=A0A1Y2GZE1_9FUNG|nr:hypothetical protein BCR41DRAFT_392126 [Lobosporangium transversale]ORZ27669.1 hypothetical protein BCR41DRAFT_392126 [Lobosporangium transversale]|eukprot:XP_021885372.1 hypothetical protein BCR41DRAFT_392126 [Lobosporangium transversale]